MAITLDGTSISKWVISHFDAILQRDFLRNQIHFVEFVVPGIFSRSQDDFIVITEKISVVFEYSSQTLTLPVYFVNLFDGLLCFLMGCDQEGWTVSVITRADIDNIDFTGLFDLSAISSPWLCPGFPRYLVFGSYLQNQREFTFQISEPEIYKLYTVLFLIARRLRPMIEKGERHTT